jgi:cobalt-zinc-cadmium efflux system outer membrane protein
LFAAACGALLATAPPARATLRVVASILLAIPALAEPVRAISLADAIALAVQHNPDFRSTGYDVRAAQGAVVQASVLPNPSILVSSLVTPVKPLGGPVPNQFGLNFTVPLGGKISAATAAAQAAFEAAKATREGAHRQLVFNVQTAFVAVQLDQLLLSFARQDQEGFHKELDLNELRYKDGKISFGDLLKLRIQAVTTDDGVREAIEQLESARADLRRVVGEDVLADDFQITGDLIVPPPPKIDSIDELLSRALARRPDYQALLEQEKSARSALSLARRTPIPDLGFLVDYNRPQQGVPPSYDLLLTVPIPLFDRNQGNIIQAEATYEKTKLAEASLRTQLRSDLWKGLQEWQAASGLLAVYQGGVVEEAKESLEIRKHAYELGNGTLLDFLDAEASYRQIESAYRAAFARTVNAANNIQFTTGEVQP